MTTTPDNGHYRQARAMSVEQRLNAEDFPFTIEALRSDTEAFVWGVTVLPPRDGGLVPLWIPPCAKWAGVPVLIKTINGTGITTITGPYDEADEV